MIHYVIVESPGSEEVRLVHEMFLEYQRELDFEFCFQGFSDELETLPAMYAPPSGRLVLVYDESDPIACGGLRDLGDGIAELKRIYVKPHARRHGVARELSNLLIEFSRRCGYRSIRLDTLGRLTGAIELYRQLGFEKIDPYYENSVAGVLCMEKSLDPETRCEII